MGGSVSQVFRSGSALLTSHRDGHKVSKATEEKIQTLFEILRANPKVSIHTLESLLVQIAKHENILYIHDDCGYNILQRSVGLNHIELTKWLLHRHRPDVNRSPCSLPLHIACLKGYEECVELLLKHGARIDTDSRMCFPGTHSHNCEESGKYTGNYDDVAVSSAATGTVCERYSSKLQNAVCYAIDGDQINVLNILAQKMEDPWIPFRVKKPLLHLACERGAWNCVQQLVITRSEEINLIKDEYYPIHQAVLHDGRFLELLIQHGAQTRVRTCTQQMTLLHVVIFAARKSAEDTLATLRILLERGCKELINEPDSLGNTPLHALIVRYALEEARYGYDKWSKWDVLHLVRFLLQNGAKSSINQAGNSALACVFRHVRDWEVCFELLNMLIKEDGDPNIVGRDGSVPMMVLLVPLINKDQLHHFTHSMKVCYLNCIRILLQYGANPNCSYRANLTPLHVLVFTVSENFTLNCEAQKRTNFEFIKNILLLLLQHGLDCNQTYQHILRMVQNVRTGADMQCIYELTLMLIQYGADPNIVLNPKTALDCAILSNELSNYGEAICTTTTSASTTASSSSSSSSTTATTTANIGNNNHTNGGNNNNNSHHNNASAASATSDVETSASSSSTSGNIGNNANTSAEVINGQNGNSNAAAAATAAVAAASVVAFHNSSFRANSKYILFYYVLLIAKKEFILNDPELTFTRIIHLFFLTMQHEPLYHCLKLLHNFYVAQVPSKKTEQLIALISSLYKRPRSLKQLARLTIYEAINRRLAQNINRLNLPGPLKEYVLSFER